MFISMYLKSNVSSILVMGSFGHPILIKTSSESRSVRLNHIGCNYEDTCKFSFRFFFFFFFFFFVDIEKIFESAFQFKLQSKEDYCI